jgi:hypothetical protein
VSCETHTTPVFGCSGCIDARKRGEWASATVRKVRHVWQVSPLGEVSVTSELRVPDGATERDVERECFDTLSQALVNHVGAHSWSDRDSDEWREWWGGVRGRSRLLSLSIGAVVVEPTAAPAPVLDQPSLFGGGS